MFIDAFCGYPFNRCRITCEGWVAFCCYMRPDFYERAKPYIGNVLEQTFDEIWFNDEAEAVRKSVLDGNLHSKCQCAGCPFVPMNKPYPLTKHTYNEYPNFLEIDLPNTHCNVGGLNPNPITSPACIMCERSAPDFRPENNRLFEVLERIRHLVPNLCHIHVQGIAEPFYQTREDGFLLFEVLDALDYDRHANQIKLSLTTNGTLFKKSVREQYIKRVPRSITVFSIDAATPETFRKIRIFDCFEKVIENLTAFSQERNRKDQFLKIHNNINTENVEEVLGMVHLAHEAGVDCVEFNPTSGFCRSILVNDSNCGRFLKAQEDIVAECKKLDLECSFLRPLDLGMTERLVQLTL